jgi:hypothetical protein
LNAITASIAREIFGGQQHRRADTATAHVAAYVDTLDLTTPTARVLEVLEDDDLADADDLAVDVGHQNITTLTTGLFDGCPVVVDVRDVFELRHQRSPAQQFNCRHDVVVDHRANERHRLLPGVDRRQDADGVLDRLGGVQTEVLAKERPHDLNTGRQTVGDAGGHAGRR